VRARLLGVFVALLTCVLAALSVPFAQRVASDRQQAMFLDRLQDTTRFASAAEQASDDVDDQALQQDLTRYHEVYGVAAAIVDRTGAIRHSSGSLDLRDAGILRAEQLALSGHQSPNPSLIWPTGPGVMAVAVPIIRGDDVIGAALTVSSTARLRSTLTANLELLAVGDVAVLVLVILLAAQLANWVLRPVYVLDGAARQISTGNLTARAGAEHGPVEIRRLATSFNQMAQAVESVLQRQQAFVADASHQLRNPLTALTLRLESLATDLDGEPRAEVDEILAEAGRLSTILSQLLELAAVQHALTTPADRLDAVSLVAGRLAAWRPPADQRDLTLDFRHPPVALVRTDETLASSILDALLDNAIKFSPAGGRITVEVAGEEEAVRVRITDQGPGLSPAEFERIGDRFWRAPATQDVPGSGLGLSIATELAAVLGAGLRFAPAQPHGLAITLALPRAPVTQEPGSTDPQTTDPQTTEPQTTEPQTTDPPSAERLPASGAAAGPQPADLLRGYR
jgi:signal transduction histidine kinase